MSLFSFESIRMILTSARVLKTIPILLGIILYFPHLKGLPIQDDHGILNGRIIGGGESIWSCFIKPFFGEYFRPLTSLSYFIDLKAFGPAPFLFHQTNLIIHLLTSYVVFCLAYELTSSKQVSVMASVLYVVSPGMIGAVAWIGGRTDALSTFFSLVAVLFMVRASKTNSVRLATISGLCFGLALFSKEQAISLLPGLLVTAFYFSSGLKFTFQRIVTFTGVHIIVTVVFLVLWFQTVPQFFGEWTPSLLERLERTSATVGVYSIFTLFPNPWGFHAFSLASYDNVLWRSVGVATIALAIWMLIRGWKQRSILSWTVLFLICGIGPISNIVMIPSLPLASYRTALATPFIALSAAALITYVSTPVRRIVYAYQLVFLVLGIGLLVSSYRWYSNDVEMLSATVSFDKEGVVKRQSYAMLLANRNEQEALRQASVALSTVFSGDSWRDPSSIKEELKKRPEILKHLQLSVGNRVKLEEHVGSLIALYGSLLLSNNKRALGIKYLEVCRELAPRDAFVPYTLGALAIQDGELDRGEDLIRMSLELVPDSRACFLSLGEIAEKRKKYKEALNFYLKCIEEDSLFGGVFLRVAVMYKKLGENKLARQYLDSALSRSLIPEESEEADALSRILR